MHLRLVTEWGKEYAFSTGLKEEDCRCELMAIGSARLGLQDPSSDIDCVVVAAHKVRCRMESLDVLMDIQVEIHFVMVMCSVGEYANDQLHVLMPI